MEFTFLDPRNLFGHKPTYAEWIEESVEFFLQLGFFESYSRVSTPNLIAKLEKLQQDAYGAPYRPSEKTSDFDLIAWDKKRVWFDNADVLALPGNDAYVQALQELCFISRKQFSISSIEEVWEGEEGPIFVRFTHKRKKYEFSPRCVDTYFDYGILKYMNTFLEDTRFTFELCGEVLEDPIVLLLHEEEKKLLEIKRGWKFVNPTKN